MFHVSPDFLLSNPDLVTPKAPWCTVLDNLELGITLLTQPWLAGEGLRRAEIEHQLAGMADDLPIGPVYFQRVNRAVTRLEKIGVIEARGEGRRKGFVVTAKGFVALILNLRVLSADPTIDGSEFELKRALVAMWNLVFDRFDQLADDVSVDPKLEAFLEEIEAIEVLGKPVVSEDLVSEALDVRRLLETQKNWIRLRLAQIEARRERLGERAELLKSVDLGTLSLVASGISNDPATTTMIRSLAATELPSLGLEAAAIRYQNYIEYLNDLAVMYGDRLEVAGLATLRRFAVGGR